MKQTIAAIAAALCMVAPASAQDKYGLHLGSVHFPKDEFNNFNPGAYARWNNGLTVGGFYNSERRVSLYAGYTYEIGRFAVTMGAVTGYRRSKVLPMVIPTLRVGSIHGVDMRLAFIPKLEKGMSNALHLMLEF